MRPAAIVLILASAVQAQVRIIFAGDIMLDNGPGHIVNNGGDPFAKIASILKDADLTVGNLECAISRKGVVQDKNYTFRAPLASLPLLRKYFSAVSLANNHTGDWGKEGFADSLTNLEKAGVPYFGGGHNSHEAHQARILEAQGKRIAFLGYNDFPPHDFAAGRGKPGIAWLVEKHVIADIQAARRHADYVLLFFHWGKEMHTTPEPYQQNLARKFIEAGADAVIGGHPHVPQTVEWHRDRPIVYSLGNLVFDYYPPDPPIWLGWIVRLTLGEGTPKLEILEVEMDPAGVPYPKAGSVFRPWTSSRN